jgi:hypothetical protein
MGLLPERSVNWIEGSDNQIRGRITDLIVVSEAGRHWLEIRGDFDGESWSSRVPIARGWTMVKLEEKGT